MKQRIVSMVVVAMMVVSLAGCTGSSDEGSTGEPVVESSSAPASPVVTASVDDSVHDYVLINDHTDSSPVVQTEDSNLSDAGIVSVKVLVQGSKVAVYVCATQDAVMDSESCNGEFDTVGIDDATSYEVWTGTRDGSTAVVKSTDEYLWGTVTFDGSDPAAPVTTFVMAAGCVDVDGAQGVHDPEQSGACKPGTA